MNVYVHVIHSQPCYIIHYFIVSGEAKNKSYISTVSIVPHVRPQGWTETTCPRHGVVT